MGRTPFYHATCHSQERHPCLPKSPSGPLGVESEGSKLSGANQRKQSLLSSLIYAIWGVLCSSSAISFSLFVFLSSFHSCPLSIPGRCLAHSWLLRYFRWIRDLQLRDWQWEMPLKPTSQPGQSFLGSQSWNFQGWSIVSVSTGEFCIPLCKNSSIAHITHQSVQAQTLTHAMQIVYFMNNSEVKPSLQGIVEIYSNL